MEDVNVLISELEKLVLVYSLDYGLKLVQSILILLIGFWIARKLVELLGTIMVKRGVDESLQPFLKSIISIGFKVIVLLCVVQVLGVPAASFLAVLGSAGLAIGLALQGSLSNFAGGVLILTVKPFRKGDFITTMGVSGTVHLIHLLNTVLKTPDNQTIFIPNGQLAGATVTNFSVEPNRRLVMEFGIHYKDDIRQAKGIIEEAVKSDERVLVDPAPQIVVISWGESSINISTRIWVKKEDYWAVNFDMHEKIKYEFDDAGITIPFPQRDLHVYQHQLAGAAMK